MSEVITIREGDLPESPHPKLPIVIILDRLRSAHNVGNILRLADAVNAIEVACCGYTPMPPHPKLEKTAMGTDTFVKTKYFEHAKDATSYYKNQGYEIVAVETVVNAECIWDSTFKQPTAIILGNEALGTQQETLECCDRYVTLPAFGRKNSINVSNCAAVVLYKVAEQLKN